MRAHPIPPVTEPFQYRAIGVVRATYRPVGPDQFTRGYLVDENGESLEAVVLGRMIALMRRHLVMEQPHLWVVYPRCRQESCLHLQIAGIWEPSTLERISQDLIDDDSSAESTISLGDQLPEGDDFFSIRGELIFTKPENEELVIKVRQRPRSNGNRPLPFKIKLKGNIPLDHLRNFVSLNVRRQGQGLLLESFEVIGPMPVRGGHRKVGHGAGGKAFPKGGRSH